jgi:hypothetical protein
MGLFRWYFRRPEPSAPQRATVSFDDKTVTCRWPDGVVEALDWADLRAVLIRTTDAGPAGDDMFWVLKGGPADCVVPSESAGIDRLMARLQRLPGFDHDAAIRATYSTDNREFVCWKGFK